MRRPGSPPPHVVRARGSRSDRGPRTSACRGFGRMSSARSRPDGQAQPTAPSGWARSGLRPGRRSATSASSTATRSRSPVGSARPRASMPPRRRAGSRGVRGADRHLGDAPDPGLDPFGAAAAVPSHAAADTAPGVPRRRRSGSPVLEPQRPPHAAHARGRPDPADLRDQRRVPARTNARRACWRRDARRASLAPGGYLDLRPARSRRCDDGSPSPRPRRQAGHDQHHGATLQPAPLQRDVADVVVGARSCGGRVRLRDVEQPDATRRREPPGGCPTTSKRPARQARPVATSAVAADEHADPLAERVPQRDRWPATGGLGTTMRGAPRDRPHRLHREDLLVLGSHPHHGYPPRSRPGRPWA